MSTRVSDLKEVIIIHPNLYGISFSEGFPPHNTPSRKPLRCGVALTFASPFHPDTQAVMGALASRGVLSSLRAQLRHAVYEALDDDT